LGRSGGGRLLLQLGRKAAIEWAMNHLMTWERRLRRLLVCAHAVNQTRGIDELGTSSAAGQAQRFLINEGLWEQGRNGGMGAL
jgi:hypothetical protein